MRQPILFCVLLLAPSAGAQAPSYRFSPSGAEFMQGGSSNTVPWWSTATTYQQIHDYAEMVAVAGSKPTATTGTFRKLLGLVVGFQQ